METSFSRSQMEQSKSFGRGQRLRTSTITWDRPERGEEQEILQEKSDELESPTPLQEDSTREKLDAETISSWSYDMEGHAKLTNGSEMFVFGSYW